MMAAHPLRTVVLGAGSWGTALAALASAQSDTMLWARDDSVAHEVSTRHTNERYLPGIPLPETLRCTHDFDQAVSHAGSSDGSLGLIILGVPVAGLADTCHRLARALASRPGPLPAVVWTCKGFDHDTAQLPHEIASSHLGSLAALGVLSGPSFAHEVARGLSVALTIASQSSDVIEATTTALHGRMARIYASSDVVGVEVGGALKNVIAIACGISDGLGLGANARAALITRGLAEIQRMGVALGGLPDTFYGLTGMGDLVLTATGDLSRNRQVGMAIGQGQTLDSILAKGITAEGVRCANSALALGRKHNIDVPITEAVCNVLFEGVSPQQAVIDLLSREARPEQDTDSN